MTRGCSLANMDLGMEPEGHQFRRGASSPPERCQCALEQSTNPQLLRVLVHGQPPSYDISPFSACTGPECACVCSLGLCVRQQSEKKIILPLGFIKRIFNRC